MKGWKGPAKVIGQEGKIVLIRHGTAYYRCHPCQLMKADPESKKKEAVNRAASNIQEYDEETDI